MKGNACHYSKLVMHVSVPIVGGGHTKLPSARKFRRGSRECSSLKPLDMAADGSVNVAFILHTHVLLRVFVHLLFFGI